MIFDRNYAGVLKNGLEYYQDGAQKVLEVSISRQSILRVQTTTTAMEVQRSVMMFSSVQLLSRV